jgi:SAM-dependent methyltransferase
MSEELYEHPEYYDIAFSWDVGREIEFFGRVFGEQVPFAVRRILEPCCGTGRFLLALPRHGYAVVGYDVNPGVVEYARRRIDERGDPAMARAEVGDMVSARYERAFDAALNSINSLGYLHSDDDIVSHFANTGASLKPGGVYIVHISCAWDGRPGLDHNSWVMERDGVSVRTTWSIEREDRAAKLSHQLCATEIDDRGERSVLVDRHVLRLWHYNDLRGLVARSGSLRLVAVYSEDFRTLPLEGHKSGEMGNLYYVLKAT